MSFLGEYKRRSVVPLAGLVLAAYFFGFYLPLARKAEALNEPLNSDWKALASSLGKTNANRLDFQLITNQLAETRQSLALFQDARARAASRLELGSGLRARLEAPFELVEFENARSALMDELIVRAKQQKVPVDPAVLRGFPEHTADVREPSLLWAELSAVSDVLDLVLKLKASAIHYLDTPSVPGAGSGEIPGGWAEIPIELEFTSTAGSAANFLLALPLRNVELKAMGLPEAGPEKLPILIDRLVIKRVGPEKPDDVRVWLRLATFVPRE